MKKAIILFLAFLLIIACVSCTIPVDMPEEGRWYCEELKIEIDFALANIDTRCARLYNDDGTYQNIKCGILGSGFYFMQPSDDEDILILAGYGKWKKRDNEFIVTSKSDGTVYTFVPVSGDETTSNDA